MVKFIKNLEIEWRILLLAAVVLFAFAFPLQRIYISKLRSTLNQSVDPRLEPLLRSFLISGDDSTDLSIAASLKRNRQWQALIPMIIEEQNTAMISLSVVLFFSLLFLAFWSLKRLTKPLRDLAGAAVEIGMGRKAVIRSLSSGALGKLESTMVSMQDELIKLRERARVQGMESAWREIARVMAHEIKNPLTPIQLTLDRIQEKTENGTELNTEDLTRFVDRIGLQVANLERLVNDFRSFAREPEPRCTLIQLRPGIELLASDMQQSIYTSIDGDAYVYADPHLLNRAFLNIWKNSMEAGASQIDVKIRLLEEKLELTISDNGPGIPGEQCEQVWVPYVTFKKGGTGLGLPVVKRLFESMNADIRMVSSTDCTDHGVTMIISFNRVELSANENISDIKEEMI